jgi:hypothetical protein
MHIFSKVQKGKQKMDIYKCPFLENGNGLLKKMCFVSINEN